MRDDPYPSLVHKVDADRWEAAQRWELAHWERQERSSRRGRLRRLAAAANIARLLDHTAASGDDWNKWWATTFDHYSFVPRQLDKVLELGCGPYTNVRLIRRGRKIAHIYCSDPLVMSYVRLRGCWVAEAYRRAEIMIDDHPAEECPFSDACFDLTVMINVLDHVQDLYRCLDNAQRVTAEGGLLLIGQDLTNRADAARVGDDVGHPIRMEHEDLDRCLLSGFEVLKREILPREKGRNPEAHYGTYIFAGRKLTRTS